MYNVEMLYPGSGNSMVDNSTGPDEWYDDEDPEYDEDMDWDDIEREVMNKIGDGND